MIRAQLGIFTPKFDPALVISLEESANQLISSGHLMVEGIFQNAGGFIPKALQSPAALASAWA